jgi:hypothetical protein
MDYISERLEQELDDDARDEGFADYESKLEYLEWVDWLNGDDDEED